MLNKDVNEGRSLFVKDRRVALRWFPGSSPCFPETLVTTIGLN